MNKSFRCGIISHRGLCRVTQDSPRLGENTIEAFEDGIKKLEEMGLPGAIECDIRLTKDGVPIIMHDDFIDRTTNGRGEVGKYLFKELQKFDAGYGRHVPSLSAALDHFKNGNVLFHIELKENNLATIVARMVSEKNLAERVIVSAFDSDENSSSRWSDLYKIKDMLPIALLANGQKIYEMGGPDAYIRTAYDVGACAVHPEQSAVSEKLVSAAHEAGLKVNAWVVNDLMTHALFSGYGVDNVFSDNPEFLT